MLNVKMKYLRNLVEEIYRLESIQEQMAKSRDSEKKKDYYKNLEWCRKDENYF